MIGNAIRADLSALGLHADAAEETSGISTPQPEQIEDWLGLFYVLEGSSLGARLLVKRAASINITESNGASHLAAQAGNAANWSAFLGVLEAMEHLNEARMIHWANETFSFAHQAFETVMENNLADH